MKRLIWIAVICSAAPLIAKAQGMGSMGGSMNGGSMQMGSNANPVSTKLQQVLDTYAKNLVATAEEVPVEKYTFHPTPEEMTIGATMAHIANVNNNACSKVGGVDAPKMDKLAETDKDKLVENLKASMDFCRAQFATLTDAKLADSVPWYGGRQVSRISAAMEVTNDLVDHYASLSVYVRLNGMLPPTAQKKP